MNAPPKPADFTAADRKAKRIAFLEQREADREARARAPVGWLENYNDSADDLVRGLIRGFE